VKLCLKISLIVYSLLMLSLLFALFSAFIYYLKESTILSARLSLVSAPTISAIPETMITQKLTALAQAMAEYEGWLPDYNLFKQTQKGSVAYRNHNPGNLRISIFALGIRDGFAYFYNDATGFFAMCYDIFMKAQGKTSTELTGNSTLRDLIKVWSAGTPEGIEKYTSFVCGRTGLTPDTKLKTLIK